MPLLGAVQNAPAKTYRRHEDLAAIAEGQGVKIKRMWGSFPNPVFGFLLPGGNLIGHMPRWYAGPIFDANVARNLQAAMWAIHRTGFSNINRWNQAGRPWPTGWAYPDSPWGADPGTLSEIINAATSYTGEAVQARLRAPRLPGRLWRRQPPARITTGVKQAELNQGAAIMANHPCGLELYDTSGRMTGLRPAFESRTAVGIAATVTATAIAQQGGWVNTLAIVSFLAAGAEAPGALNMGNPTINSMPLNFSTAQNSNALVWGFTQGGDHGRYIGEILLNNNDSINVPVTNLNAAAVTCLLSGSYDLRAGHIVTTGAARGAPRAPAGWAGRIKR